MEILLEDATTGERLMGAEEALLLCQGAETRFAKIALLREAEILARQEAEERAEVSEQRAQASEQRAEELARLAEQEAAARRALEEELERLRRTIEPS